MIEMAILELTFLDLLLAGLADELRRSYVWLFSRIAPLLTLHLFTPTFHLICLVILSSDSIGKTAFWCMYLVHEADDSPNKS